MKTNKVQKGDILDYWGTIIFFNNPIISYQRIKDYRVERMEKGKILLTRWCQWNLQMKTSH